MSGRGLRLGLGLRFWQRADRALCVCVTDITLLFPLARYRCYDENGLLGATRALGGRHECGRIRCRLHR